MKVDQLRCERSFKRLVASQSRLDFFPSSNPWSAGFLNITLNDRFTASTSYSPFYQLPVEIVGNSTANEIKQFCDAIRRLTPTAHQVKRDRPMTKVNCAICGGYVERDTDHVRVEAEHRRTSDRDSVEEYAFHTSCWNRLSEGWMEPA